MRKSISFLLYLIIITALVSCKTYKPAATSSRTYKAPVSGQAAPGKVSPESEYIRLYKELAISEMIRTGVPASITLAQGMIESDYGRSRLSLEGNNHFGIKCHNGWKGGTIYHDDDKKNDCFRKYQSPGQSYTDHSDFLRSGSRYGFLFDLSHDDYKSWAHGLKKAGYATNPDYANMLIRKIEALNLSVYDKEYTTGRPEMIRYQPEIRPLAPETIPSGPVPVSTIGMEVSRVPRVRENNRIQYIIVKEGDTREKLEKDFRLLKWELPKYNELDENFDPSAGQILYLQPKREKAEPGKDYYTAAAGDTFYGISQKFGIKLKSLYELNRVDGGTEPEPGKKIWLRVMKPVR